MFWLITLGYHLPRSYLPFCRHPWNVQNNCSVYFRLLRRECVLRIDSLLTKWETSVIKFEGFRRKRSRLPTYCVSSAIGAHFFSFVQADTAVQKHFSPLLPLFLSRFARMFSSLSFYHFYWAPTTVVIEVDQGLWTRCHSVGRKCHGRSSCAGSRLLELFHALSRAQLES